MPVSKMFYMHIILIKDIGAGHGTIRSRFCHTITIIYFPIKGWVLTQESLRPFQTYCDHVP